MFYEFSPSRVESATCEVGESPSLLHGRSVPGIHNDAVVVGSEEQSRRIGIGTLPCEWTVEHPNCRSQFSGNTIV
jgi:hypothetical protein